MLNEDLMRFWAENGLNVLISGPHGVGKTAIAKKVFTEVFGEHGKDWIYFSAATMDPWVDFVGVPKEVTEDGNKYLSLVKPKHFADGSIKAIIFDEFNRSPAKVRNAVMELIQFKSINGQPFENLKCIWACINPHDDDTVHYDVDELDGALLDRFHIMVDAPYAISSEYFIEQYGETGKVAAEWWESLPEESKRAISPRRLEYAVQVHQMGGSVRHVIPKEIPVSELITQFNRGSFSETFTSILNGELSEEEIKNRFKDQAFLNYVENRMSDLNFAATVLPYLPDELIEVFISSNSFSKLKKVFSNIDLDKNSSFKETLLRVFESNPHLNIKKRVLNNELTLNTYGLDKSNGPDETVYYEDRASA